MTRRRNTPESLTRLCWRTIQDLHRILANEGETGPRQAAFWDSQGGATSLLNELVERCYNPKKSTSATPSEYSAPRTSNPALESAVQLLASRDKDDWLRIRSTSSLAPRSLLLPAARWQPRARSASKNGDRLIPPADPACCEDSQLLELSN